MVYMDTRYPVKAKALDSGNHSILCRPPKILIMASLMLCCITYPHFFKHPASVRGILKLSLIHMFTLFSIVSCIILL